MPNADYSVLATAVRNSDGQIFCTVGDITATNFRVRVFTSDGALANNGFNFQVHASNSVPPKGTTGADAWGVVNAAGGREGSGYNFGSVNKTATGVYEVSFATAMPSAQYAATATCALSNSNNSMVSCGDFTTSGFTVRTKRADVLHDIGFSFVVHATNAQLPNTVTQEQIDNALKNNCASWGVIDGATGNKYGAGLNFTSTRTAQGNYTVTFDNPMPNDAYAVSLACQSGSGRVATVGTKTRTSFQIRAKDLSDADADFTTNFAVHATNAPAPKGGNRC